MEDLKELELSYLEELLEEEENKLLKDKIKWLKEEIKKENKKI